MADKKPTNREKLNEITASIERGIKELFQSGGGVCHDLRICLRGSHAQRSSHYMRSASLAEGRLDGLHAGAVCLAGDLLQIETSGHNGQIAVGLTAEGG